MTRTSDSALASFLVTYSSPAVMGVSRQISSAVPSVPSAPTASNLIVSGRSMVRFDAVGADGTEGTADEIWRDTPITAGDEYVTRNEASAESEVRVIWSSEDGSVSDTLAQATV